MILAILEPPDGQAVHGGGESLRYRIRSCS
jgi:hypothetical protein